MHLLGSSTVLRVAEQPTSGHPPGVDISSRVVEGTLVLEVAGEVDLDTAPQLQAGIIDAIERTSGAACIVDLTHVSYLGSAGLTVLLASTRHAEARSRSLPIVVDSNRPVIRPIELTGMDDDLRLFHSVEEALRATRGR
jgi:anti-sigma B factor antagonist